MSVTNGNDDGPGSLREALLTAPSGSEIIIEPTVETITLSSSIVRLDPVTIVGRRAPYTIITNSLPFSGTQLLELGDATVRLLAFTPSPRSGIAGVIMSGTIRTCWFSGWSANALGTQTGPLLVQLCNFFNNTSEGCIFASGPELTVRSCGFYNNVSTTINGIVARGDVSIIDSRFHSCQTSADGVIGLLATGSSTNVLDCRFYNNTATASTTIGVRCLGDGVSHTAIVLRCTFENNTAPDESVNGIYLQANSPATLILENSTFSNGTANYSILTSNQSNLELIGNTFNNSANTAIGIIGDEVNGTITNCTITNNVTGISYEAIDGITSLYNVTVARNTTGINVVSGTATLYNSIVSNNDVDISGNATGFNNLISNGSSMTGIVNGSDGNIVGQDPLLGDLGVYGGPTLTIPLLLGSPAINSGNNAYVTQPYDQRGEPFARIVGIVDMGAFEVQDAPIPCFLGKSLVLVRERDTGMRTLLRVSDVSADKHDVFDMSTYKFIPVLHNCIIQGATRLYKIPKDSIDKGKPYNDLFITSGHPIQINGKSIKARDIEGAVLVKVEPCNVYSIVTRKWCPIEVNGIGVYSWSKHKWFDRVKAKGIVWSENRC